MKNTLFLIAILAVFTACQTTTDAKIEGDPVMFEGSFLLEGENTLKAPNPNPLYDYADHMQIERTQINSMHAQNLHVEITDNVADSLLIKSLVLKVAANGLDTAVVAKTDNIQSGVIKHELQVEDKTNLAPYFQKGDFNWLLVATLEEDYEELLPFKVTMDFKVKYEIK